ncbi:MAG: sulfate adenylyltransferase subunit 2 [Chloroflexi bacterium]|nr:sulfate adenylyltransferase subunit 2 [Chloroflexota bacterium]
MPLDPRSHLAALEAESIFIIREVACEFQRPVVLFSGGKDSLVVLHLAHKAFAPQPLPFPVMHVDTGHNFEEVIAFRDGYIADHGDDLIVASVQASIDAGRVTDVPGPNKDRNRLQTVTLLDAIAEHRFDAVFGGARRDEEKARAKERIFSVRDEFGQWDPRNQRPEPWDLLNGRIRGGQQVRVFPISNWTELDVWQYIQAEGLPLPTIYFSHVRDVFLRKGMWLAVNPFLEPALTEPTERMTVRFRTVGDMTCTGAILSTASTVDSVIEEIVRSTVTERGATRADDTFSETAMEDRKKEGYF